MTGHFAVFILFLLVVIEVSDETEMKVSADPSEVLIDDEITLSRSLGYSAKRSLIGNLEDKKLGSEYLQLYQDMLKASRESYEKVDVEEAKLETVVGKEKAELMKRGLIDRRLSIAHNRSPAGNRRVRSQATRREKLNNQSLRSHQYHTRIAANPIHFHIDNLYAKETN